MAAIGVARLGDRDLLLAAGADLVVPTPRRRRPDGAGRGSPGGAASGAAAERLDAGLRRLRPGRQGLREALCALKQPLRDPRCPAQAGAGEVHYPGTYVAGLYNRARTEIGGRAVENEELVNVPNWLPLGFRVADGPWFDVQQADVLDHRLELDLRQGDAHPVPAVAGPGRPPHQRGPAPPGQPKGPAPGRPGDDLYGRELVGDDPGPLRAGRPGGQRRRQAVPRPQRPPPGGAARRRGGRRDHRAAGRDQPVARAGCPGRPDQAPGRPGRPGPAGRSSSAGSSPTS